jgi:hypothetical protein
VTSSPSGSRPSTWPCSRPATTRAATSTTPRSWPRPWPQPAAALGEDHSWAVDTARVFGVPTFITAHRAVFVRLMDRPATPEAASSTLDRVLTMVEDWPDLNEFKATAIPR